MVIQGKNLRLKFNDKLLMHATECSIDISSDTEEIASKDTQGKEVISSDYGYTLSTSALYSTLPSGDTTHMTSDALIDAQLDRTLVEWEFTTGVEGQKIYSGQCYVTSSNIGASNGSIANTSFTLTGTGDITRGVVPA